MEHQSRTSKSKTFDKESEFFQLIEWVNRQIDCTEREIIQNTPPDYDVKVELNHKYIITVTKVKSDVTPE